MNEQTSTRRVIAQSFLIVCCVLMICNVIEVVTGQQSGIVYKSCSAWGDPHYSDFTGKTSEVYVLNKFYLMKSPHLTAQIRHNVVNNAQCTSIDQCTPYGNPSLSDALAFNYHGATIEIWRGKVYVQKVRSVDFETPRSNYVAIDPYRFPGFQHRFANGLHQVRVVERLVNGVTQPVISPAFAANIYYDNPAAVLAPRVPDNAYYPPTPRFPRPGHAFCPSLVNSPNTPPAIIQPGGEYVEVFYSQINSLSFSWNINVGPWWQSTGLCNDPQKGTQNSINNGPLSFPFNIVNNAWHNLAAALHFIVPPNDDAFTPDGDNQLVDTGAGGVVPWTTVRTRAMGFINKYPQHVPYVTFDETKMRQAQTYCQAVGFGLQTDQGRACVTDVALGLVPSNDVATFLQNQLHITIDSTESAKLKFLATLISNLITNLELRKNRGDLSQSEIEKLENSRDKLQLLYSRLNSNWKLSSADFQTAGKQLFQLDSDILKSVKAEIQNQIDQALKQPSTDSVKKTVSLLQYLSSQFNL